jgi:hypothetical protein
MSVKRSGWTIVATQPPRPMSSSSDAAAALPTSSAMGGELPPAADSAAARAVPRAAPVDACAAKMQPDVDVATSVVEKPGLSPLSLPRDANV